MTVTALHERLFGDLEEQPSDPLLALIALAAGDERPAKIDLGVGVYRDEHGRTPVMRSVKAAERRLLETQETKAYLGAEGDIRFVDLLEPIVFGPRRHVRRTGVQTPGGTGALRLGAELIRRARPDATIWLGTPTWANHQPIFAGRGLEVRQHPWFDPITQTLQFGAMMEGLGTAHAGDVIVLHGGCHNPTGAELDNGQWAALVALMAERGLVPFVDFAYHGLGRGLESDAHGTRLCFDMLPEAILAYSCDKNFGLYRERVGAFWVQAHDEQTVTRTRENVLTLTRPNWSMPPDHGAAIVRLILDDETLAADWRVELDAMRQRITDLRVLLAVAHPRLAPIGQQTGMFSILPLSTNAVRDLRVTQGIYMADSGRINVAGLKVDAIDRLVEALSSYL